MGMFDTVNIKCPECGTYTELQSKAGICELNTYFTDELPPAIAVDINGEQFECDECGYLITVGTKTPVARVSLEVG